jgi:hypothetical protein
LAHVPAIDKRCQKTVDGAHVEPDLMGEVADPGGDATARERFEDVERSIDRLNRRPAKSRAPALFRQDAAPFVNRNGLL